jgi:RND family efflux transporter MFP subunit
VSEQSGKQVNEPPPPLRRNSARRLVRRGIPIALLVASGIGFALFKRDPAKLKLPSASRQPIRTKAIELRVGDYPVAINTHGVVRPHNEYVLSALVPGRISRFSEGFEDGAFFEEGDVLVEIESDDYRNAVAMADAKSLGTKAALELAAVNHRRNTELLQERLLPPIELDRTAAVLAQVAAEADSATAQLERARRDLERTKIRAPFPGRVHKRSVRLGQHVGPGMVLGTLFAVDWVEVRLPIAPRELRLFDVPEESVRTFELPKDPSYSGFRRVPEMAALVAPRVNIRDAADPGSDWSWSGQVVRAEAALDPDSKNAFVIARVEDPFGRENGRAQLRPGQSVAALIQGRLLTNVVAVPRAAFSEPDRVFLVDRDKLTLSSRRISPIWADETHIVVSVDVIPDRTLVAISQLVGASEGEKVEIIPDIPEQTSDGINAQRPTNGATASP